MNLANAQGCLYFRSYRARAPNVLCIAPDQVIFHSEHAQNDYPYCFYLDILTSGCGKPNPCRQIETTAPHLTNQNSSQLTNGNYTHLADTFVQSDLQLFITGTIPLEPLRVK